MKVMVVWKTVPGKYKTAVEQFLRTGGPLPAGAKDVGCLHTPGSTLGGRVIETNDLTTIAQTIAEWADVLDFEVYPVIEDAEAAAAATKVFGKELTLPLAGPTVD